MPKMEIRDYLKKEEPEKKEEPAKEPEKKEEPDSSPMGQLKAALGDSGIDAEKLYAAIKACSAKSEE